MKRSDIKGSWKWLGFFVLLLACTTPIGSQKGCTGLTNPCDQDGDGFKVVGWVSTLFHGRAIKSYCPVVPAAQLDCNDQNINNWKSCSTCVDMDADGYFTGCDSYVTIKGPDCNDSDPATYPGATEICDGEDNNCDASLMPGEDADADGDGFPSCMDCDDNSTSVYPGAAEVCDGLDNNCDGIIPADETTDLNSNGIFACADPNDTLIPATIVIKPEAFNKNTGEFTAFVTLPAGIDIHTVDSCIADGAIAESIIFNDGTGEVICKFNRDDITVLPVDVYFEVSGTTTTGLSFFGTDTIKKVIQ
jgi:hypothetical protein